MRLPPLERSKATVLEAAEKDGTGLWAPWRGEQRRKRGLSYRNNPTIVTQLSCCQAMFSSSRQQWQTTSSCSAGGEEQPGGQSLSPVVACWISGRSPARLPNMQHREGYHGNRQTRPYSPISFWEERSVTATPVFPFPESRPLSLPVKVTPATQPSWASSEERVKEIIARVWDAVKQLTLQVELQSCCVFLPSNSLPSPSTIICGDIPGTVRSWYHNQASMPGTVVVCLPRVSVLSAGHRPVEPLQELPFVVSRPVLEEGDAFPWTVSLSQFGVYTLLGQQRALCLLEPVACTSTLAVTSHGLQSPGHEGRHAFVVCLHVDLEPLHVKCSNPQVQLLYELFHTWSTAWSRMQRRGILRPVPSFPDPPPGAAPASPVRSSTGTVPPDTSTCSPSADFGSPTEGDSVPAGDDTPSLDTVTLEQKTSSIGSSSGKVSLWMQWMLPKVTVKLFAPDPVIKRTEICVISELEDLSASVDVQDVYTKIKCKVGSFNIDHYKCRPGEGWQSGRFEGVVLQCKDKAATAAKVLEAPHQQHGFLSVTYTQAVTKNVRHKLTARQERGPSRGAPRLSEGLADGSPQHLREILLTAQPFDVVLSCPLLAAAAGIFRTTLPRRCREKRRSPGQPMRSHALSSSSLPLIYVNTSVIRIFCPVPQDRQPPAESHLRKEDTLVLKIGSVSMAPQADNPLSRTVLRKDIYQPYPYTAQTPPLRSRPCPYAEHTPPPQSRPCPHTAGSHPFISRSCLDFTGHTLPHRSATLTLKGALVKGCVYVGEGPEFR
ncbi:hypothetical protein Z043_103834 [Scleropages formosus]|uniref:Chorein N-terminal domain-containing protein n=1 Tax=Scleropages formosus TaxID=113540 RepID=A0A0N8K254_SCLFO|nr:hypothetical protein Z043_103834 [Scleropages formosus]